MLKESNKVVVAKRHVHGLLLLDKPVGLTSNRALQIVKRAFSAHKAGHTGSLDPIASGLLPICLGEATKVSQYLLNADKTYHVEVRLGIKTSTGDTEGDVIETRETRPLTKQLLDRVLTQFTGEINQIPPMFSALKLNGKPLYSLARKGIVVDRKSRPVTIHKLALIDYRDDMLCLHVQCSRGTYIRTLVEDVGEKLGVGGHVVQLKRVGMSKFDISNAISLDVIEKLGHNHEHDTLDKMLLPMDDVLEQWPNVVLTESIEFFLKRGQAVTVPHAPTNGYVRIYSESKLFLGVGHILDDGRVAPSRLVNL